MWPDPDLWLHARAHDFIVVSKDADFSEISMELGFPPKLIWLRIKNWSTHEVLELLRSSYPRIVQFGEEADRGILILFKKAAG